MRPRALRCGQHLIGVRLSLPADLSKPIEVFQEMHRVLKPGGKAIMSFSNRCFPTKGAFLPPRHVLELHPLALGSTRS